MLNPDRDFFIKDGVVMKTWQFDLSWMKSKKIVYEVLRVIDGIPLFVEEHIDRLIQSAAQTGLDGILDLKVLISGINKLIDANSKENGNILICLIHHHHKNHILLWYVPHHYPSPEDYQEGVNLKTVRAIRKKPHAKIWNSSLRKQADYLIEHSGVYEVLLVDGKKDITEGSRSNIFFIRGNSIFTPPLNKVLPGITREKIMLLCDQMLLKVSEKDIALSELTFYESAFLTGTSPGVLPIKMIDTVRFNTSNEILQRLMLAYDQLKESNIRQ